VENVEGLSMNMLVVVVRGINNSLIILITVSSNSKEYAIVTPRARDESFVGHRFRYE